MTERSPIPRTVLVCGGRDYADRARVLAVLNGLHALHPIGTLVHGAAAGADTLGVNRHRGGTPIGTGVPPAGVGDREV